MKKIMIIFIWLYGISQITGQVFVDIENKVSSVVINGKTFNIDDSDTTQKYTIHGSGGIVRSGGETQVCPNSSSGVCATMSFWDAVKLWWKETFLVDNNNGDEDKKHHKDLKGLIENNVLLTDFTLGSYYYNNNKRTLIIKKGAKLNETKDGFSVSLNDIK